MRSLRTLTSISVAILVAAAPGLATASPPFPEAIKADLSLTYSLGTAACLTTTTPDCHCTICHTGVMGGAGTSKQPFAVAMKTAGLQIENVASLQAALAALEAQKTDTDCDGTPDIEQLKQGRDPNTGAYIDGSGRPTPPATPCMSASGGDQPAFGCGAQLARAPAPWQGAATLLAALGAALARRRRR